MHFGLLCLLSFAACLTWVTALSIKKVHMMDADEEEKENALSLQDQDQSTDLLKRRKRQLFYIDLSSLSLSLQLLQLLYGSNSLTSSNTVFNLGSTATATTPAVVTAGQAQPIGSACIDDTNCQNNGGTCQTNTIPYEIKITSGPPCQAPVTGTIQSTTASRICRCTTDRMFACSDTLGFVCTPPGTATVRPGG